MARKRTTTTRKASRSHPGINKQTGRLKKGWKFTRGSRTPVRV